MTSADEFISHALGWFGDETKGEGKSPWDRGQLLADLVRKKRTLLLPDGLELLQSGQAYDRGKIKEVMGFATRCGLRLQECDTHLEFSRLEVKQGQPDAARVHVRSAASLVSERGYHRRDGELLELKEELGI